MNRREFLLTLAASSAMRAEERPPNLIFILADDMGFGDIGCYGQRQIATPHLDALASEGMRFTQAYSGAAVCAPSRCSLMLGRHTGHTQIRANRGGSLGAGDVTIAAALRKLGYHTGAFGKWGVGPVGTDGVPNKQGFDEWLGYVDQLHAHSYFPEHLWQNDREMMLTGNMGTSRKQYSHDIFTRASLRFIERNRKAPFFLYVPFTIPHVNNELARDTGNGFEVPNDAPYHDRDWPQPERNYASMIHRLDQSLGQIVAKVKESGLDQQTLIIFSSDNGPETLGGHTVDFFRSKGSLRGKKLELWEGGVRAPLIARWPGHIAAGATTDHLCAAWDVLPTAVELAGGAPPSGVDGVSFLPALLGKPQNPHEFLYWETLDKGFWQAVRMGDWKAHRRGENGPIELYNLRDDPAESRDVASAQPETVRRIAGIMAKERTPYKLKKYSNALTL